MRGFGRIALVASMVLAALLATTSPAVACDFEEPPPPQEALTEATAVFAGEVVAVEPVDDDPGGQYIAVTVEVERAWKGVELSPVVVETHHDEATCGFPFEVGESYIVYAYSEGTPLTTALYHRTRLLEQADEDLQALGSGTEVDAQTEGEESMGDETFNPGLLILGAVIISIIVATVMLLRQSKPGLPDNYDVDDDDDAGTDDPADRRT
jgi:hypothetical protein